MPSSARLGINLVFLNPDRTGGAETYARSLLDQFHHLDLGLDEPITLFVGRHHRLSVAPKKFRLVECDIDPRHQYRRIIWEQTHLPSILRKHNLDLVHFPYSAYPLRYRGRSLVSIHDTTRFVAPKGVPKAQLYYRAAMERRLARNGHHVIAVSRADADILQHRLSLPPSQCSVIYHGVSDAFRTEQPFTGPRPYLLWVGRPYPHKRLDTLLQAYALLTNPASSSSFILHPSSFSLPPLRLIGAAGAIKSTDQISAEPPVPHSALPDLFRRAAAFVFPSSYESFGLPALEAMAAGTPVICSDIPAFRELFSPAAHLTPTGDPTALAAAIHQLLTNPTRQHQMTQAGLQLSSEFTWRRCAEQTLTLYHRLLTTSN